MSNSSPLDYLYDEDITGSIPANKIENELHLITPALEVGEFNFIVPKYMPFFKETMVVQHVSTGTILVPGIDWQPSHLFDSASYETEWVKGGIYGSITITNANLTGQFRLVRYQTLGGGWIQSNDKLLEILANRVFDPRTATFEQVTQLPTVFPPTGHNHPTQDWVGFAEAVSVLERIAMRLNEQTQTWLDNPPILMDEYYLKSETETVARSIAEVVFAQKVAEEMDGFNQSINDLQTQLTNGLNARYTKTESDNRYYQKSEVHSKAEVVNLIQAQANNVYTKNESDSRYYLKSDVYTRAETADLLAGYQAQINNRYTKLETDQLLAGVSGSFGNYFTKAESDTRYYQKSEVYSKSEADGRYVPISRTVSAGSGLSGGGALSANVTLSLQAALSPFNSTALNTTDLNSLSEASHAGHYHQTADANATLARNYPTQLSGSLEVTKAAGVIQVYTTYGSNRQQWIRGYYNGWSPWTQIGAPTNVDLGTSSLDGFTSQGTYYQNTASSATTARGYPIANITGILRVEHAGTLIVQNFEVYLTDGLRTFRRWKSGTGAFSAWQECSVRVSSNQFQAYVNGAWRIVWPPQFQ